MANIILPEVKVLKTIKDSAKMLVEQDGEISRYAIVDLDIGGGDVTINLNDTVQGSSAGINADTLDGYHASQFILKTEISDIVNSNGDNESVDNTYVDLEIDGLRAELKADINTVKNTLRTEIVNSKNSVLESVDNIENKIEEERNYVDQALLDMKAEILTEILGGEW